MKYTWAKLRLCRREGVNIFGSAKYNLKQRKTTPGQHGSAMQRNSEYGKLLRNKQLLKEAQALWLKEIGLVFRGTGMARDWVFKAINEIGVIDIQYIREETPIQFGGCKGLRPKRN